MSTGGPRPLVVGVGHSLGGAGCALAELAAAGTFARLLLWEPILFDPEPGSSRQRKAAGGPDKAKVRTTPSWPRSCANFSLC